MPAGRRPRAPSRRATRRRQPSGALDPACCPPSPPPPPSPRASRVARRAARLRTVSRADRGRGGGGASACQALTGLAHAMAHAVAPKTQLERGVGRHVSTPPPPPSTRRWGCTSTERSARRLPLRPTPRAVPPHGVRSQQVVSPARQAAAPRVAVNRAAPSTMRAAPLSHPPLPPLRAPAELRGEPRGFGPSLGRIEDVGGVVRVSAQI